MNVRIQGPLVCVAALVTLSCAPSVDAETVERGVAAAADGLVVVRNDSGNVRILGWDEARVEVTGEVGADTRGLVVEVEDRRVVVEVVQPAERGRGFLSGLLPDDLQADLEVRVPRNSTLSVDVRQSDVEIAGVTGAVDVVTVSSTVVVRGRPSRVSFESVSGLMRFEGRTPELRAQSLNGEVRVNGEVGSSSIETVSGDIRLDGSASGDLSSLSGDIAFTGTVGRGGRLSIDAHGGDVALRLPAGLDADFRLLTVKGRFDNRLEPGAAVRRRGEARESTFTQGAGGAAIVVETYGGDIRLERQSG